MKYKVFLSLAILFAVVLCYSGSVNSGFVWDDVYLLTENPLLRAPLWSFYPFRQDIANSGFADSDYYRPLQMLSYAVDYRIWGIEPVGFRLTNLFLHFLNGILVYLLAFYLSGKKRHVAFVVAVLFTVHPALFAAVGYVSGRSDLLFFLFGGIYLLLSLRYREGEVPFFRVAAFLSLAFSMFSKEAAMIYPLIFLALDMVMSGKRSGRRYLWHLTGLLMSVLYVMLYCSLSGAGTGIARLSPLPVETIKNYIVVFREFIMLGVLPQRLHMRHLMPSGQQGTVIFLLVASAGSAVYIVMKKSRKTLLSAFVIFSVALVPFSFAAGVLDVFAEHWLYLPCLGICLYLGVVLAGMTTSARRPVKYPGILLLVFCMVYFTHMTRAQQVAWEDDVSLSENILKENPDDPGAIRFKAVSDMRDGNEEIALSALEGHGKGLSGGAAALDLKGRLLMEAGRIDEAMIELEKAIKTEPSYAKGYRELARIYLEKGDLQKSLDYLKRGIDTGPADKESYKLLSMLYSRMGNTAGSVEAARTALEMDPYGFGSLLNMGTAYVNSGDLKKGIGYYFKAVDVYPEKALGYYQIGYVFFIGGQIDESREWLKKAVKIDPSFEPALELFERTVP